MTSIRDCFAELAVMIQQNRTLNAIERFYADDVTMQENEQPPRIGKAVCLEHERRTMAELVSLKATLLQHAINEQTSTVFSEWLLEAVYPSGRRFSLTEVSVQNWRDGQIQKEKFYYRAINEHVTSF